MLDLHCTPKKWGKKDIFWLAAGGNIEYYYFEAQSLHVAAMTSRILIQDIPTLIDCKYHKKWDEGEPECGEDEGQPGTSSKSSRFFVACLEFFRLLKKKLP